uniref:Uncharacterized protein n=1 Tax=Daphnia magna TaxID=35525 RepID=A0A0N8EJT2_9CRUS
MTAHCVFSKLFLTLKRLLRSKKCGTETSVIVNSNKKQQTCTHTESSANAFYTTHCTSAQVNEHSF